MITLRDYQQKAHDSVFEYWKKEKGNPLIVAPCGAGKGLILAALIKTVMSYAGTRVLVLTHRKELLEQDCQELHKLWHGAPTAFYSAGIGEKSYDAPIIFAGIQSIEKKITDFEPFDLCLIDEAHLLPRSAQTRYGRVVNNLKLMRPTCRFIGLTATPYRLDSGMLHSGEGALFDAISYEIELQTLIDQGYLCEVVSRAGVMQADMTSVKTRGGEFVQKDMAAAFTDQLIKSACDQIILEGQDRRAWLLFCASVEKAELARDYMRSQGIETECITGADSKTKREGTIERFKAGKLRCLVNVDVLTIGFNAPITDLCALLRATDSTALYVQIVGRIMRTYPGKHDALLLDFGGNVARHGCIDDVRVKATHGDGTGDAPAKECPECALLVPAGVRNCPDCGHEFPPPKPKLERRAYRGAVMKAQRLPETLPVMFCTAKLHHKRGKPTSVKVTYTCGDTVIDEWLCPEHGGFATQTCAKLVSSRYGVRCPATALELMNLINAAPKPSTVTFKRQGKYNRIISVDLRGEAT